MEFKRYDPCGPHFLRVGRHDPAEKECCLWWSGSGVRMEIACTCLEIEMESPCTTHAPWIGVLMDGAPVCRFPLGQGVRRYVALAGIDADVKHEVTIIRDTQTGYDESSAVKLLGIYADGEPAASPVRPLRLEFVGDSLTVGEGCLGPESAEEWRMIWISHMPAFPTLVSEALHAEKDVVALGGWGAARSWDNDKESRIGRIYDQLCGVIPGGEGAYHGMEADAVVINLGTNDGSALNNLPENEKPILEKEMEDRATELMEKVRARHPHALILWAYGLCGHQVEPILQKAVKRRQAAGDTRVQYLSLTQAAGNGSRMHPSRAAHRKAAEEIGAALRTALKL